MDPHDENLCPFCGGELPGGTDSCPHCGLPLAEPVPEDTLTVGASPRPEYSAGPLRLVTSAGSQAEADVIESVLRAEGIPCHVQYANGASITHFAVHGCDLFVPESGIAAARAALDLPANRMPAPAPQPVKLALWLAIGALAIVLLILLKLGV